MKVVAVLALLVVNMHLSRSCYGEGPVLFCQQIQAFSPGYSSLVIIVRNVGEINSTVLCSDDLASVTRLRIVDAGVTGVAEGAFSSLRNLSSVSLEQNLLTEINPSWFSRPAVLNQLNLSENRIEVLNESMLNGFSGLSKLYLNKNRIRTIDPNCFSFQTNLAVLDLSDNRMTRFPPQVFESLSSTRMRLHGNPWDCSCDAEGFVDFLKDLQNRSQLEEEMRVTCDSPPSLRGRPVWNVSACVTSPTQTVHPETTDAPNPDRASTATLVTKPPSPPLPETTTSLTDVPAPTLTAATSMTSSPPSDTETSTQPKSSALSRTDAAPSGITETRVTFPPRPLTDPNIVRTLTVVIVVLCVLLCVVCVLAVLRRRKRNSKAVMPGSEKEENMEVKEDGRSGHGSPGLSEKNDVAGNKHWDSEAGWRKHFTGVRAKSANALLFTSPFCMSGKDQVTSQTETEASSEDTESPSEGKKTPGNEREASENITDTGVTKKNEKQALDKDTHCVSVNTETVPYLSIGTNQNKPSLDDFSKQSADAQGQRSQTGKRMARISTWPPTAVQWQGRCNMKEQEEERADESFKFPGERKKVQSKVENPSFFHKQGVDVEEVTAPTQDPVLSEASKSSKPNDKTSESEPDHVSDRCSHFSEAHNHTDLRQEEQLREEGIQGSATELQKQNLEQLKPAGNLAQKISSKSSSKGELRNEPKTRESRHRAENRSTGSKAPSGGASPDDETLLCGSEYAFMDLLHEVVQNNGRWTRERWRQVNKQRHSQQGQ